MSELKPCPFCGNQPDLRESEPSRARFNEGVVHFSVSCSDFDCEIMPSANLWQMTPDEAVRSWNKRKVGWISVAAEEPPLEKEVLVKYESGIVTTGWRRQFRSDDILYCLGTKEGNWDMEINNDLGGEVIEWMPIP